MAAAAMAGTAPPEFTCYGVIRRVDMHACLQEGVIHPRYATFHRTSNYIGLRTTAVEVWDRVKEGTTAPAEFYVLRVTFSAVGFMHFSTSSVSPGVPHLHKVLYTDGIEWNCWRFNGSLPLQKNCDRTGVPLVRAEFVEFGIDPGS